MFPHHMYPASRRRVLLFCFLMAILLLGVYSLLSSSNIFAASAHVDVMVFDSEVNPVAVRYLTRSLDMAEHDGAQALVIEIDTPGGDIDSMKSMVQAELASSVPVIAYVSPTGGRAASAGAFVALAAQIVAMAPATRIGASSPVSSTGANLESTLQSKVENDLVASMTSIQKHYNRNIPLATAMITKAMSYDDKAAVQNHLVDIGGDGAASLSALLDAVDGQQVALSPGRVVTLHTAGVGVQQVSQDVIDELYGLLLDPNVIFLLFVVAMIGIYLEISHPGAILPGVAGSIALLLFLFGAGSLTPNWAGLALMILAFVLLVLDVRLPTHGILTAGAVIALIIGALLFFNSGGPYSGPQINPLIVYVMGAMIGLLGLTLVALIVRVQRHPIKTGVESMIGASVMALTPLLPEGRVRYEGEDWAAVLDSPASSADEGSVLQIVSVEGLRLHVRFARSQPLIDTQPASLPG